MIISDNVEGNKYHSEADGKFVSPGGGDGPNKFSKNELHALDLMESGDFSMYADNKLVGLLQESKKIYDSLGDDDKKSFIKNMAQHIKLHQIETEEYSDITSFKEYSLRNYEDHRKKMMPKLKREYEYLNDKDLARAKQNFQRILDNAWIGMNFHARDLASFLEKGVLNQFETHKTGGSSFLPGRAKQSIKMFGSDILPEDATDREKLGKKLEKYGCLKGPDSIIDDRAHQYGDSYIVFKKDKMINRTTFTIGDSLGSDVLPPLISEGFDNFCWRRPEKHGRGFYIAQQLANASMVSPIVSSVKNFLSEASIEYIETQMHGDVTIDDMDTIYLNKGSARMITPEIYETLKQHGIKLMLTRYGQPFSESVEFDLTKV